VPDTLFVAVDRCLYRVDYGRDGLAVRPLALPSLDEGRGELYLGGVQVTELKGLRSKTGVWEASFDESEAGVSPAPNGPAPADRSEPQGSLAGLKELDASLRLAVGSLVPEIQTLKDGQLSLADQLIYGQDGQGRRRTRTCPAGG
jgi:hypothetical protein